MVLKSGLHSACECAKLSLEVFLFHAVLAISLLDCNIVGDVVTASEQRSSASYFSELDRAAPHGPRRARDNTRTRKLRLIQKPTPFCNSGSELQICWSNVNAFSQ